VRWVTLPSGCIGLWNARDEGPVSGGRLGGEMGEVGDVLVPLPRGAPVVVASDIEVGLDQDGGGRGRECGGQ